jgi:hypothetical protein
MLYTLYMNIQNLTNEEKLNEIFRMTEENNKILRGLRRTQYVSNVFRILYWTVIIASLAGAYYFIKPMIAEFAGEASSLSEQVNSLKVQFSEAKKLQQMLQGQGIGGQ